MNRATAPVPTTPGEFLKEKQRHNRESYPEDFGIRVHRAISWVLRAEKEQKDPDARFIFLWIAFNSAYSVYEMPSENASHERKKLKEFFEKVTKVDVENQLYDVIWENFPAQIRNILDNKFVFAPFWNAQNNVPGSENWQVHFDAAKRATAKAIANFNTSEVLSLIFSRLYVLRNQLIHGGATWASETNRAQVKDGAQIMNILVPIIIDLMLENPGLEWGNIYYNVTE